MRSKLYNTRGIVLVATLVLTVFLVMFAGINAALVINQQRNTSYFYHAQAALKTAEAGVHYAMSQLEKNSLWQGCSISHTGSGEEFSVVSSNPEVGVEIYEYPVNGDPVGFVEGKVVMGNDTGYFDYYFAMPANDSQSKFFKNSGSGSSAGPMPERIVLSRNNNSTDAVRAMVSTGEESDRMIPGHSVFLVCRGQVGGVTRMIEVCLQKDASHELSSVVVARGDIDITIWGNEEPGGKPGTGDILSLLLGNENRLSFIRANQDLRIGLSPEIVSMAGSPFPSIRSNNYVFVEGACRGKVSESVVFSPMPASFGDMFDDKEPGQDGYLPRYKLSKMTPSFGTISNTIQGGTYVIGALTPGDKEAYPDLFEKSEEFYRKYPRITYYPENTKMKSDDLRNAKSDVARDMTLQFADMVGLDSVGSMTWDYERRKLVLNQSFKVQGAGGLNNLIMIPEQGDSLALQVGDGEKGKSVFLVNDRPDGQITLDASLGGTGCVFSKGDIDFAGQSMMSGLENAGVGVYSEGNVIVREFEEKPYIDGVVDGCTDYNLKMRILSKLGNERYKLFSSSDGKIDYLSGKYFDTEEWNMLSSLNMTAAAGVYNLFDANRAYVNSYSVSIQDKGVVAVGSPSLCHCFRNDSIITNYTVASGSGSPTTPVKPGNNINSPGDGEGEGTGGGEFMTPGTISVEGSCDSVFRGLIYSCKDFIINSKRHRFILEGALVAYGRDPETDQDNGSEGSIRIDAKSCSFRYHTGYLNMLQQIGDRRIKILYWVNSSSM